MMLGDLGARVIKVEAPAAGDDSRGWGPPFVGPDDEPQSTYFMCANRNKESVTADLKSDEGKTLLRRLVAQADVCARTSGPACSTGSASPIERAARAQPAAGRALDHRLRPRRARGRPGRLRPDRPGRGRPDEPDRQRRRTSRPRSASRSATCWPACTAPTGSSPRCTSGRRTGRGRHRPHQPARGASSGCTPTRARGGPSPARCRARSATTTRRSARTACSTPPTRRSRSPAAARGCGGRSRRSSASTRTTRASPPTALRVARRDELTARLIEAAFAAARRRALAAAPRRGRASRPARSAPLDDVYTWEQTLSQGLLIEVDHPDASARSSCPGRRCASTTCRTPEAATAHLPPPRLGEHNDAVLAWLDEREQGRADRRTNVCA